MPLTQQELSALYERVKAEPTAFANNVLSSREDELVSSLIFVTKKALEQRDKTITALSGRVQVLEAREQSSCRQLEQLEQRRLNYRGDWEPGAAYVRGDLTTHHGSCWYCEIDATGLEPTTSGLSASAWKVFVSRGRPGKDAR